MAITARILLQIILMVFLRRIEIEKRTAFYKKLRPSTLFKVIYPLRRFSCSFVCVINSGLILTSHIVSLPILHRRIYYIEICKQQSVKADLFGIILYTHRLTETGAARTNRFIVGIRFARAVGIAALGIDNAGDRLHQVFQPPETAAGKIDHILLFF